MKDIVKAPHVSRKISLNVELPAWAALREIASTLNFIPGRALFLKVGRPEVDLG